MRFPFFKIKGFEANIQPKGDFSEEFYTKTKTFDKPKSFREYNKIAAEFGKECCVELTQFDSKESPTATVILTLKGIFTKREFDVPLIHIVWLGGPIFRFDKIED